MTTETVEAATAAEEVREFFAGVGHRFVGGETEGVRAGGVAVDFLGGVQPGFPRLAHDRRSGVVIEIEHSLSPALLNIRADKA